MQGRAKNTGRATSITRREEEMGWGSAEPFNFSSGQSKCKGGNRIIYDDDSILVVEFISLHCDSAPAPVSMEAPPAHLSIPFISP
jgi:hypothetical protein